MKKGLRFIGAVILFLVVCTILNFGNIRSYFNRNTNDNSADSSNMIAMYIQDDKGNYNLSDSRIFPTEGYILDEEKSECTSGGLLSQNVMDKSINIKASKSSTCNLYFEKVNMAKVTVKVINGTMQDRDGNLTDTVMNTVEFTDEGIDIRTGLPIDIDNYIPTANAYTGYIYSSWNKTPSNADLVDGANLYYERTFLYQGGFSLNTLRIDYIYEDGSTAADSNVLSLSEGTEYYVSSPHVEGYTPQVKGVSDKMPNFSVHIKVIYLDDSSEYKGVEPLPVIIQVYNYIKPSEEDDDPVFGGTIVSGSLEFAGDLGNITYTRLQQREDWDDLTAEYTPNPKYIVTVWCGKLVINGPAVPDVPDVPTP